jgi:hypothetical protein
MKLIFADTFYWIALLNSKDDWHQIALHYAHNNTTDSLITTDGIIDEVLNYAASRGSVIRQKSLLMCTQILREPNINIITYPFLSEEEYRWQWSRVGGFGLQGLKDDRVHLKWYPSGTQLFQVFQMPENAYYFEIEWQRATLSNFVENVIRTLAE